VWLPDIDRFARYLRPDEMHTAFNFDFLARAWDAAELRASIDGTLAAHRPVGAPATWVLSNHDVTRPVTRYGREDSSFAFTTKRRATPTDVELGTRRARAAALLTAALPGSLYIYQGDELGLDEVEDLPEEHIHDPIVRRSGGIDPGRDGCRVPLPWSGVETPFGFSPADASAGPWLPQPARWAALTAEAQIDDPDSMLSLYRRILALRRREVDLATEAFRWLPSPDGVLAFVRGERTACVVNLGDDRVGLPAGSEVLATSAPLEDGLLALDTAVWVRLARPIPSNEGRE
jgi:alpha-glucosidase